MSESAQSAIEMIEGQIKELDGVLAQANSDLNTVAASERVAKWKAKTIPLLAQHLGPKESQRFSGTNPGPSFTNDLLEEISDEVDVYRTCLMGMVKELKKGL